MSNNRLNQKRKVQNSEIIPKNLNQEIEIKNKQNINNEQLKNKENNYGMNTPQPKKETQKKMSIDQRKQMFENKPTIIKNNPLPKGVSKEIEKKKQMFENNNIKNNPVSANKIMIRKEPNEQNKNENNNKANLINRLPNRIVKKENEQKKQIMENNNKNMENNPNPANKIIKKENQPNKQKIENNNPKMTDIHGIKIVNKNENDKNNQIPESNIPNNLHPNKILIKKNEQNKQNLENNNLINNNTFTNKNENIKLNKENQPINNNKFNTVKTNNQIINDPNMFPMNNKPTNNTSENKSEKKTPSLDNNDINRNDILSNKNNKNILEKEEIGNDNILKNKPYKLFVKTENEKEDNKPIVENSNTDINQKEKIDNLIIPMINSRGSNNCFINVLIQILYHSPEFRKEYLKIDFKNDTNNFLLEIQNLFNKYQQYQKVETKNILNVNILRKKLSELFKDIEPGICGDPVEILNHILNAIHLYKVNNKNLNDFNASKYNCNLSCLSHKFFSIKLQETNSCNSCEKINETLYDENYFIYEIFVFEILEQLHNKTNQLFRNKLFIYSKDINTKVPPNLKLPDCTCEKPNIKKELIQCGKSNPYLVINLTWDNPIPKMTDVCKLFNLIPLNETNFDLFRLLDVKGMKKDYHLYAIILFYNGHYTCAINTNNIWYFIDDVLKKRFQSYKELIKNVIYNHYHPVVLFYSNYIKNTESDKEQVFDTDEYMKIFKFCNEFDQSRELNVSNAVSRRSSRSLLRKSSNKVNQAIEYVNSSKKGSKLSSSTISSNEGWICLYCKKKNKNTFIKCWCCKRVRNVLPSTSIKDSNSFNLLKDSSNIKGSSALFLNEIPTVNSIKVNNINLKESIEYFLDKKNSSIEVLRSKSNRKKNDTDDDDDIIYNDNELTTFNKETNIFQFDERKNIRKNSSIKNEDNDTLNFNKSNIIWNCKKCGKKKNNSKFCPDCGMPRN